MSVSAPRMTVQSQSSLLSRVTVLAIVLVAGALAGGWMAGGDGLLAGLNPSADRAAMNRARDDAEKLRAERDQLSSTVNAAESQLNIERSAQKELVTQIKTLEGENARLKEDLVFFESLLPADTGPQGISIRRLKVDPAPPNQLRYQVLAMQGGKGDRMFVGNVQLTITALQAGKSVMINFPEGKPGEADKFKVAFKHYQRVEGTVTLPDGAIAKTVQAKVLENGQIRTQMTVNL